MLMYYLQLIETEEDQQLFTHLYETHKQQMQRLATSILRDPYWAEDAVHNAFEGIANNMDSIRNRSKEDVKNYVLTAVRHTACNIKKKETRRKEFLPNLEEDSVEDSVLIALCDKETVETVTRFILELSEPYRTVLYYHFIMELRSKEIASMLHRKPDAVRQQLSRGKTQLKRKLMEVGI